MTISNNEDIMDSRDIIEFIDGLEEQIEDLKNELDEDETAADVGTIKEEIQELEDELAPIKEFAKKCEDYSDWNDGVNLIRASYFEEYARDLADYVGATSLDLKWPLTCIDWKKAAEELKMDYTGVDFDGVTYYYQ